MASPHKKHQGKKKRGTIATLKGIEGATAHLKADISAWQKVLLHEQNRAERTCASYLQDLTDLINFLATHRDATPTRTSLTATQLSEFRSWLAHRNGRGVSPTSNARAVAGVRSFFSYLKREHDLDCPALARLRPATPKRSLPRPLASDEAKKLLEALGDFHAGKPAWLVARDRALLLVLWGAGLRLGEATALTLSDIPARDTPDPALRVVGKGNKERIVPLLPILITALYNYHDSCPHLAGANPDEPFFRGTRGGALAPRIIQMTMQDLRRRLGLPESATPHALRHSFCNPFAL